MWINSWTKHIVTDAELVFTFCKLYELFKTNTSVVVQYLKNNFMDANERQNPWPKIKNFLVTLEKTVWDYKFDMDMQLLPCFGYLSSDKLIISNDVKVVIKMLNGWNNQLDQPFGQPWKLWGLFSNDEEPRPSSRNSSKSLNNEKVKWDFDELSNNQLVNDNWLNSKPRYTLCTIKWKTIQISPLYVSEDYESLKKIILEKGKHRNSTFDDIVWATTKVTSSLSNVALWIRALQWNIVTSFVEPKFKNDWKWNNNSDNIPEPKDKLPNWF